MIQFAMVVLLILTPRSSNPFSCRYRGSASAYFSYMICDTRDAEAYPPGISAGLPSSFMNRVFTGRTPISGGNVHDTLQFCPGITEFCPYLFMAGRDHAGSALRALLLFFGQRIYFFIVDWKICEHLIIVRFGLTFLLAGLYFDELRLAPAMVPPLNRIRRKGLTGRADHCAVHWNCQITSA